MDNFKESLKDAMTKAGITNSDERAMIAAIAGGESDFQSHTEEAYTHTSNSRIRMIFSKTRNLSETQLNTLKADPVKFFDLVYGGRYGNVPGTDDGYKYRGRGPFQLTFKDNYKTIGQAINIDIVSNPDLVNDLTVGAQTVVAYIKQRYHGGGWQEMKDCVGYNTPDIAARKDSLYEQFKNSGEFN